MSINIHLLATALVVSWLVCSGLLSIQVQGQDLDAANLVCLNTFAKFSPNHTACLGPSPTCRITDGGINARDQKLIVDVHNYYRNLIASGNETQLGFPSAANMLKMEWDPELAYVAQMHANQCQFQHDCYECRRTDHHSTVGQNLYIYQTSQSSIDTQWRYVVKEWYDEIKIAPPVVAQSFDLFNLNIGHFTQIAWASTNRVGCGIVTYDVNEQDGEDGIFKTAQLYTCNYAPGGNFLGEKMYEDGHPVTQCPSRYGRSKRFTSLCEYSRAKVNKNLPPNKKNKKVTKVTKKVITTTTTTRTRFNTASINNFQAGPVNQNENNLFPASSLQPSVQPSTSLQPSTSFQPSTSSLTPSTTSLLPSTSIIPSSSLQPSSTPSRPSTTTRRVTSTNSRTTRKPTKRPSSTKPGTTAVAVTQSNKRVSNWWDKWSINFENQFNNNPKAQNKKNTSTTRAPSWKTWSWTWSSPSKKPSTSWGTTSDTNQAQAQPSSTGRFVRFEMSHNGTTTHRINQPI